MNHPVLHSWQLNLGETLPKKKQNPALLAHLSFSCWVPWYLRGWSPAVPVVLVSSPLTSCGFPGSWDPISLQSNQNLTFLFCLHLRPFFTLKNYWYSRRILLKFHFTHLLGCAVNTFHGKTGVEMGFFWLKSGKTRRVQFRWRIGMNQNATVAPRFRHLIVVCEQRHLVSV